MRGTRQLCDGDAGADLRRDGHQVAEEGRGDLSQLKNLHRRLHTHVDKQDVQHSAAMKVGDLTIRIRISFIGQVCAYQIVNRESLSTSENKKVNE